MRFYQNTVPLQGNKTQTLEEFAAKILNKQSEPVVKTASAKDQVKTAEEKKEKDECETSGQPEWEGKKENVNDPEDKSEEKTKKEAKWNFEKDDDDKEDKEDSDKKDSDKEEDDDKEDKDAKCAKGKSKTTKTAEEDKKEEKSEGKSDEAPSSGQLEVEPLHQKGESEEASKVNDGNKEASAVVNSRLVKISKLDGKTKNMLVDYYKKYYPAEYVNALVQEK